MKPRFYIVDDETGEVIALGRTDAHRAREVFGAELDEKRIPDWDNAGLIENSGSAFEPQDAQRLYVALLEIESVLGKP